MPTQTSTSLEQLILPKVNTILERNSALDDKLSAICSLLHNEVEHFDWVGFYLADKDTPNQLILGPFVGEPTEHTVIPFGKGICGQVAVSLESLLPNHF